MNNLLIVDDSLTVRKVIEMLLVPLNYNLDFASNGKEALHLLKAKRFDISLVDIRLPDADGLSLSREIKKASPSTKVILMISAKDDIGEDKMREGLVDDVLVKPFDSATIISKLESLAKISQPEEKEILEGTTEEIKFDLDLGDEFTFSPKEEEPAELEEVIELSDLELLSEGTEREKGGKEVEDLEEIVEEELSLEDLLEEGEIKIDEEPQKEREEDNKKVNLDELFSDLNEILMEKEEKPVQKDVKIDVKPVVEELAKELKELESLGEEERLEKGKEELEELDIWDFELEEEEKEKEEKKVVEKAEMKTFVTFEGDRESLEKLVKEITYEVVEKIAWEIVPEIVDTVLKDKFGKK